MDRRKSLKLIATGAIAGVAVAGCKTDSKEEKVQPAEPGFELDRNPDELEYEKSLLAKGKFFTDHEMATITVLVDIIIPKDDISGSASEAKVPEFIDFIVRDMPAHQIPMRGGLRWLDMHSLKRFEKTFKDVDASNQLQMVDEIAYPVIKYTDESGKPVTRGNVKPGLEQGIAFFSLMRNLTATGFYTSAIGVKDIGYVGNAPNKWNGVPDEVLEQYKLAYTEKEIAECVKYT
jgi:hypothetical protein